MTQPSSTHRSPPSKGEVVDLYSKHVSSGKVAFFQAAGIDFALGRREGPYLWDMDEGREVIDCHCNGGVFNLGHRNPAVIQALTTALEELDIGNHHLISQHRALLAQRLAELAPGKLAYTVFGVGGGEAIDLAIKVARGYTGRAKVISAQGGYHGHTGLAIAAGDEKYRARFGPRAPGFVQVPFDDLEVLEKTVREDTAAVLLETVPATFGMAVADEAYFAEVRRLCDQAGALLIIDEVQSGLGRTGRLWAIEHYGIEPDIMVIGKGLSGGVYPITATSFREELEVVFHEDPFVHISTFGGAEIGCRVALTVLDLSSDRAFLNHVRGLADVFAAGVDDMKQRHAPLLVGLRQLGLMMGIEMVNEHCGPLFTQAAYRNGLLSVYANNDTRVAQLLPPLNIDGAVADEILIRVDKTLTDVAAALSG